MNMEELRQVVASGETETVEFKRTTGELVAGTRTACAMLNRRGGFVLFGVGDEGRLSGQPVSAKTREEVAVHLHKIEPPAFPDLEEVPLDAGRSVLALRVAGGGGPYTYDGRPYVRSGSTTSIMPQPEYQRLLLEKMHGTHRWENRPAEGLTPGDLDGAEIVRTVEEAIRRGRMEDPGTRDPRALLLGLNLIEDDRLLNAAIVLFGRPDCFPSHYSQCSLRLARFRGRDALGVMEDNRQEVGNAFDLLIRAQRFLRDHLPIAGRVLPNIFEREDDPLYPPVALREALANALCHRDYAAGGGAVSIGIYDDRLEISSTGVLPFGLTVAALLRPHRSRPWNPLIAEVFYRRGVIERWGRGTLSMVELTMQAGMRAPEWEEQAGEVVVRFNPTRYVPPTRVAHDLSPLQREILAVLAQTGPCSLSQISARLPVPPAQRTLQDNLVMLRHYDLVELGGSGRGARWMLKPPLRADG